MSAMNLVAADLKRLTKDKSLKVVMIIIVAIALLLAVVFKMAIMLLADMPDAPITNEELRSVNLGMAIFIYFLNLGPSLLGLYVAIVCSVFFGADFAFNTIRNKLISGNSRVKVYLSSYFVSVIIGLFLTVFSCLMTYLINMMFFGYVMSNGYLIIATLLSIPLYLSLFAVMTFISMATKSRSLGITINILALIFVPFILSFFTLVPDSGLAKVVEYVPYTIFNEILNTEYLSMSLDIANRFIIPELSLSLILRCILVPIPYIAAFTGLGIVVFKNTDIK